MTDLQQTAEPSNIENPSLSALVETEAPVEEADSSEPEYSATEKEALAKGWKPDGGPKSAEEYLRTEPLYDELRQRGKEIKELKAVVTSMKDMMSKQEQRAYQQALDDIKHARVTAIQEGDVSEVTRLDGELDKVNRDLQQYAASPAMSITPKVQDFMDRNKNWLEANTEEATDMRLMAEAKYIVLKNQGKSEDEIVDVVEATLKRSFPNYFQKPKPPQQAVESSSMDAHNQRKGKSKHSFNDLSAEQKEICRRYERLNVMDRNEYIDQLISLGELK